MKNILFCILLFSSVITFSQLTGDLVVDKRKVVNDISYIMEMKAKDVYLIFDIAVNTEGKVTSCVFNRAESTINSRRYVYEAKNKILMDLKFERDNGAPTFHRGRVTISSL